MVRLILGMGSAPVQQGSWMRFWVPTASFCSKQWLPQEKYRPWVALAPGAVPLPHATSCQWGLGGEG